MEIELDIRRSAIENAAHHYEQAKKYREKAVGAKKAIEDTKRKLEAGGPQKKAVKVRKEAAPREWYEAFHWFRSTDGFLVIGGRDARQNEIIVAKHMSPEDVFLHADVHGAPATVIKAEGRAVPEATLRQAAQFAAAYSSAWKSGQTEADAYAVKPAQVSKQAPSGEFLAKGAFMIRGERQWFRRMPLKLVLGFEEGKLVVWPAESKKEGIPVEPGPTEKGPLAEQIRKLLLAKYKTEADADEIARTLPPGKGRVAKS